MGPGPPGGSSDRRRTGSGQRPRGGPPTGTMTAAPRAPAATFVPWAPPAMTIAA